MSTSNGWWEKTGWYCKWCGGQIKVWNSEFSEGYEGDEVTFCSMMCEWEYLVFVMRHR